MPEVESPVVDEGRGQEHTVSEDVEFLGQVDETPEEQVEEKVEEKIEEPEKKVEEKVEELPTDFHNINKKYPNFFKDFPGIAAIIRRENGYSELFATVEEARDAQENSDALVAIRERVLRGDVGAFLTAAKEADEASILRIADNFLDHIYKVSPDAHMRAVSPVIQRVVREAYGEGQRTKNENLANAALVLSEFLFGNLDVARTRGAAPRIDNSQDRQELDQERQSYETRRFVDFNGDVITSCRSGLSKMVSEGLDPDNAMSETLKELIVDRVVSEVGRQMEADRDHMSHMDSLWLRANRSGLTTDWKSKIANAYLERARSLVPAIRNRLRTSISGKNSAEKSVRETAARKEPGSGRESRVETSRGKIDYSKTSDLDLIEGKMTYRR